MRLAAILILACAAPLAAQDKDFLTADEIDQLRIVAQEPDARIKLYLRYAQQRLDLLEQLFARQRTGRSGVIHDTLEQFSSIIDALDASIDDAISHQRPLLAMAETAKAERAMLGRLEKLAALEGSDKNRYEFALEQAMDTLRDSVEMSEQDLKTRTREVETRENDLRKQREALAAPSAKPETEAGAPKPAAVKPGATAAQGAKPPEAAKKKPSLYKSGEKKDETQKPPGQQ
jgi:hypothetical protein